MRLRSVFLESRVARRMLALFVLCTLMPLLLSDWLATAAVSQVARDLLQRHQMQATRQTGLQVFDRLGAAKAMLVGLPTVPPATGFALPPAAVPMFAGVAWLDDQGDIVHANAPGRSLAAAWASAEQTRAGSDAAATRAPRSGADVTLRVLADGSGAARLLLGVSAEGRLRWLAELQPAYVWAPLGDAAIDSVWRVVDAGQRTLAVRGDAAALAGRELLSHSTPVFLAAEFGVGDWVFSEQRPLPAVIWHGMPLAAWLALATAATVLISALLSLRQIRRTLVPLQRLTSGARALAPGAQPTRVDIAGNDEFAQLGRAFNDMAERIDGQLGSLELLASIDADVLSGTPIDAVASHVLERLGNAHPQVASAIHWLDAREAGRLHGVQRAPGHGRSVDRTVQSATAGRLDAVATSAAAAASGGAIADALLPAGAAGDVDWALPLVWQGSTRGLLLLRLPPALAEALHALGRELQARLSVAFSARDRESEMHHRAGHDGSPASRTGTG